MTEEKNYDILLTIDNEYGTFEEFYTDNQYEIFKKFIDLFKMMSGSKKNIFSLCISWKVKNTEINTEYQYDRTSIIMLKDVLLPYFEEIEEYEICADILKLYNTLSNEK